MANTLWKDQIINTVKDVKDRITSVNVPLRFSANINKELELETIIKGKISLAKDYIYDDLALIFKTKIPETVNQWLNYKRYQVDNTKQSISRDLQQISQIAGLPVGSILEVGSLFDLAFWLFNSGLNLHPRTFSAYGTPGSGSTAIGAGVAQIGDICVDTQGWFLYINTSTNINLPTWVKWLATSVMDNILNIGYDSQGNPGVFRNVGVDYTLWLMSEDGTLADRVGFDVNPFFIKLNERYEEKKDASFKKYFPLLEISVDGSSTVSDYSRSITTPNPWIMM